MRKNLKPKCSLSQCLAIDNGAKLLKRRNPGPNKGDKPQTTRDGDFGQEDDQRTNQLNCLKQLSHLKQKRRGVTIPEGPGFHTRTRFHSIGAPAMAGGADQTPRKQNERKLPIVAMIERSGSKY